MLISLWMFSFCGYYTVLGFREYYWEVLLYITGYSTFIPALMLYEDMSKNEPKWNRTFIVALVVMIIANITVIILNFTNVMHFCRTENFMCILIACSIALTAAYSFVTRKKSEANNKLFKGIVIFLVTTMIEVFSLIFPIKGIFVYFTNLTSLGVMFLFIYWGIFIIEEYNATKSETLMLLARNESLKSDLALSRIRMMTSQMQPHFLYNALSSIQQIVYEDPEYAGKLISDFTIHLRATIRSMSKDKMIMFSEELRNIKAYVNIEKVRFGDKLTVNYDIQNEDFEIIPLSIQPLVENAIRHGIFRKPNGGYVTLKSFETQDSWIVQIIDNGVGFDVNEVFEEVDAGKKDSNGLKNLMFRLKNMMNATVEVESKIDEGTSITITIPKKK